MARLEACYFCGTAEDAPLREVNVTPRRRRDDPEAAVTLTLCRSCERKLERVLSGLFEHVESRDSGGEAEPAEAEEEAEPIDRIDVDSGGKGRRGRRELFDDPPVDSDQDDEAAPTEDDEEDAEIIEEEPAVTARATVNSKEALDGVSVAEYNRVMRLLQNREFPMARGAFVDLAASAYDLPEETVETVLDAVIEQGALADRDGELAKPGEGGSA